MSDEEKVQSPETGAPEAPVLGDSLGVRKPKYWPIVISVIAVGAIAVLIAFLHWHEEPTFCNVLCHQPMDRYVEGYYSGDESMEAAVHEENGVTCLGCHWPQAKMMDLVHEVVLWVSDGFTDPLEDKTEIASEEFCGKCHDGETAPTRESATEDWVYDPHNIPEDVTMHQTAGADGGEITCSDCHKAHKASTMLCAECHSDYFSEDNGTIPEGWAVPDDAKAAASETILAATLVFDPHNIPTEVEMHQTAGSDGGAIQCADCHDNQVMVCAQCHANSFTEESGALPEGWTVPEGSMDVMSLMAAETEDEDAADESSEASGTVDVSTVPDGEYTGTGTGIGGDFDVTVTVAGGKITAVEVGENSETEGIGSNAIEQLPDLIVENNSTEGVDAVSGASVTSAAIFDAVNAALASAGGSSDASSDSAATASDVTYADGTYTGTGTGIGGEFEVTVTVEGGKIASVEVGDNSETQGIGSKAIEQLPDEIVASNGTAGVDAVSGASVTSKAIFDAVEAALADAAA